jgi:diguanylate cyclase (GGDEF)-like protein
MDETRTSDRPSHEGHSFVSWLLGSRLALSPEIKAQLEAGLFASLPIFIGGVLNTIAIATVATWRHPSALFLAWFSLEIAIALARVLVFIIGRSALRQGRRPQVTAAALLACAWAASVGFGAFITIRTEDWLLAVIICLSAAAMVCGICLRNFGTPRLAALMVFLMLTPCAIAGSLTSEPVLAIISFQAPVYMLAIFSSAFALHGLCISRMNALHDLQRSEVLNRSFLESSPDRTLILNCDHEVVLCNRPSGQQEREESLDGVQWLSLLQHDDRAEGERVLASVTAGKRASLTTRHVDDAGRSRWFDVIASPILDGTGHTMVVARDITHQKIAETQAVWSARHDTLTGLGNRSVLQDQLDRRFKSSVRGSGAALLIVDVDHFKSINDTLGHDAGDALLCEVADRLRASVGPGDLVTRIGGDEFALVISLTTLAEIEELARRIYANLGNSLSHQGRAIECSVSIGASILLKDGQNRSEIMKAADLALYAAKAAGRGQLQLFDRAMKAEIDRQQAMLAAGRQALREDRVVPFYQPKVRLSTSEIIGFEALLRWTDGYEALRSANDLSWAFDDPRLAAEISERMIRKVLDQIGVWMDEGVAFGHVAINVTAADFRKTGFADDLLEKLEERKIRPSMLQLEVTETVFFGTAASDVEACLRKLSKGGIRIALDDFGTGYASLSHLKQFPVDLLKVDGIFVRELGHNAEAEAITAAIISLGHCLGMEVVAEGVENPAQESRLRQLDCDAAQGFLYSPAIPAEEVPHALGAREEGAKRISA